MSAMSTTRTRHQRANAEHPVAPFRCPSRDHYHQLVQAATLRGLSLSQWLREAAFEKLEREQAHPAA